ARGRARSALALGERLATRPADVLVAARARPARLAGDGRRPRARPSQGLRPRAEVLGPRRVTPPRPPRRPSLAAPQLAAPPWGARCVAGGVGRQRDRHRGERRLGTGAWLPAPRNPRPKPAPGGSARLVGRGRIELPQPKARVLQ